MTEDRSKDRDPDDEHTDPDVPSEPDAGAEGGSVLTPEELDIAESEYVEPLDDDGRYVVSAGGGPPNVPDSRGQKTEKSGEADRKRDPTGREVPDGSRPPSDQMRSPEAARTLLAEELERSNARYGIDIVARFEGNTVRHRTASDDVIATFENLVQWYARHVTDGTPAEEVIDILLRESGFAETETPNLATLLEQHDLDQSDSIADLVGAIREESGRN